MKHWKYKCLSVPIRYARNLFLIFCKWYIFQNERTSERRSHRHKNVFTIMPTVSTMLTAMNDRKKKSFVKFWKCVGRRQIPKEHPTDIFKDVCPSTITSVETLERWLKNPQKYRRWKYYIWKSYLCARFSLQLSLFPKPWQTIY